MLQKKIVHDFELQGVPFRLETGEIANHAQSAFMIHYGETVVLVALTVGGYNPELDFMPLTIDYTEKLYAGGFISSSPYIKREGRPTDHEILSGRLIDHAIRSLFPSYYRNETQIIAQVISYDGEHDPVVASIIGTNFVLAYSGVPYLEPYGACRVAMIDNELVLNPTLTQLKTASLEMMVSSTASGIVSVEAEAHDIPEDVFKSAIEKAVEFNNILIEESKKFVEANGVKELAYERVEDQVLDTVSDEIYAEVSEKLAEAIYIVEKQPREKALSTIKAEIKPIIVEKHAEEGLKDAVFNAAWEKTLKKIVRKNIIEKDKRPDGRAIDEVRKIDIKVGVLPRVHGSALFTRGETQTLTIVTLGTERDAQQIQDLTGEHSKRYFHHYNMPGYANGEIDRKFGFPNRRAIGHGTIGEKALKNVIADEDNFPYTIRVVSEVTSSNGSTSMAATCSSSLALMDAGVPVKTTIGGIGVGLVYEGEGSYKIVTDIIGMEDFYGDMDFKITGSRNGVTAIQLDNKMAGIPVKVLFEAIDQSKKARLGVIDVMEKTLTQTKSDISPYAPKVKQIKIDPEKIGELIGPGGKNIKSIIEKTGVEITIDQDNSGNVLIYASSEEAYNKAMNLISLTTGNLAEGSEYDTTIVRIEPFGVFVELEGTNVQGLVHVSNLGLGYVKDLREVLKLGDKLKVKYMGKDEKGRIKFTSNKQAEEVK